jgi:hypothetical protein
MSLAGLGVIGDVGATNARLALVNADGMATRARRIRAQRYPFMICMRSDRCEAMPRLP